MVEWRAHSRCPLLGEIGMRTARVGPKFLGYFSVMGTLMLEGQRDKDAQVRLIPPGVM